MLSLLPRFYVHQIAPRVSICMPRYLRDRCDSSAQNVSVSPPGPLHHHRLRFLQRQFQAARFDPYLIESYHRHFISIAYLSGSLTKSYLLSINLEFYINWIRSGVDHRYPHSYTKRIHRAEVAFSKDRFQLFMTLFQFTYMLFSKN